MPKAKLRVTLISHTPAPEKTIAEALLFAGVACGFNGQPYR